MGKYNVPLDLDTNNSLKLIVERINDGSVILEVGSANGRLTKYLSLEKGCTVDIIEFDQGSGLDAAKYARIALLGEVEGNIEKDLWLKKIENNRYDYIIFADVLEHLVCPENALNQCKGLLTDNGSILLSIPNVAHNSVILNLIKDKFQYTECGLLDNTHLRFFTYNSINDMINNLGLRPIYVNAVFCDIGETEIKVSYDDFKYYNMDIVKLRNLGKVFQFVFEIVPTERGIVNCDNRILDLTVNTMQSRGCNETRIDQLLSIIDEQKESIKKIIDEQNEIVNSLNKKNYEIEVLQREFGRYIEYENMYNTVINSTTWKMTRPIRLVLDKIKELMAKNGTTWLLFKGLRYLKNNGVRKTVNKTMLTLKNRGVNIPVVTSDTIIKNEYNSVYQKNVDFNKTTDVKVIAFHLPQFHTFKENNEWWGEGFTEWTNTRKSKSLFQGHYQPREPHDDIGYYDLSDVAAIRKQAELAAQHGIYGFCYYYYWFSGKRLMEKPIDLLISNKDIKTRFCLCWANESWTRTWDGQEKDILIEQKYLNEDPYNFIKDIKKYIDDTRYIKFNDKPVIVVYNPASIPNVKKVFTIWKEASRKLGIGEISIWICKSFGTSIKQLNLETLVDKEIEFPPHNMGYLEIIKNIPNTKGSIFSYSNLVDLILKNRKFEKFNSNLYRTVMLCWDNTPRRQIGYNSFVDFDLKKYYQWLKANVEEAKQKEDVSDRFLFINAWNEWAEGTYLEPDRKYGYANLNTTSEAIYGLELLHNLNRQKDNSIKSDIVVQIHMYYDDLSDEFIEYVNNIGTNFDCYITTDAVQKAYKIFEVFDKKCLANKLVVNVMENKGRDVAPFLLQMYQTALNYKYLCHIHTKRSLHSDFGNLWREYLLTNLLGSKEIVSRNLELFNLNDDIGILYPKHFGNIAEFVEWGNNKSIAANLLNMLNVPFDERNEIDFPSGNMFWVRVDAAKQIFQKEVVGNDFPEENGQVDATIMHAIERSWNILVEHNGYRVEKI